MELIKPGININFIGRRKIAFSLSAMMIIATVFLLIWRNGLNLGVDFTGGVLMQVTFEQKMSLADIKTALEPVNLHDSIIQEFGQLDKFHYVLRFKNTDADLDALSKKIEDLLFQNLNEDVPIGKRASLESLSDIMIDIKLHGEKAPHEIGRAIESLGLEETSIDFMGKIQEYEYLIRIRDVDIELSGLSKKVEQALTNAFGSGVETTRVEMVGPTVSKDLTEKALKAIFFAILFIAIYISGRFELKWIMGIIMALSLIIVVYIASSLGVSVTWLIVVALIVTLGLCWFLRLKYAMGAVIALIHDVMITIGAFALTDREISLSIIAAGLTIIGYSLNDTIVVFDRIRENLRRFRRRDVEGVMNASINETLSRTILTSTTTLIVVLALFILGGGVIHDFAFAILVGVLVGTYSSIFVASPIILVWEGSFGKQRNSNKRD